MHSTKDSTWETRRLRRGSAYSSRARGERGKLSLGVSVGGGCGWCNKPTSSSSSSSNTSSMVVEAQGASHKKDRPNHEKQQISSSFKSSLAGSFARTSKELSWHSASLSTRSTPHRLFVSVSTMRCFTITVLSLVLASNESSALVSIRQHGLLLRQSLVMTTSTSRKHSSMLNMMNQGMLKRERRATEATSSLCSASLDPGHGLHATSLFFLCFIFLLDRKQRQ